MSSPTSTWPTGYLSFKLKRAYWEREASIHGDLVVGCDGACGTRWQHGPFFFEKYTTDEEPPVTSAGPWRYVIWQPLTRRTAPSPWGVARFNISQRRGGVFRLGGASWEERWSGAARRQLKHWRAGEAKGEWRLATVDLDRFQAAFAHAMMRADLKGGFRPILMQKLQHHPGCLQLRLAELADGTPLAGLATLDVPEADQSMHLIAFTTAAGRATPAGVGLMAAWFTAAAAAGQAWLDLGGFWAPGEPKSWQGFSRFKSQFVTDWLDYPRPFTRFAGNWPDTWRAWTGR
jgi:hypothetical protein